ncbi:MAG: hypothetical protein ACOH2V_00050 [Candidatus Saccharimonadaceae bacterium]
MSILFPGTDIGKTLQYKIVPQFCFAGVPIPLMDFPRQFIDMHTISGSMILNNDSADVSLMIDSLTNTCEIGNSSYRTAQRLTLVNAQGQFLSNNIEPVDTPYQFYLLGSTTPTN